MNNDYYEVILNFDKDTEASIVSLIDNWAPLFIRSRYE